MTRDAYTIVCQFDEVAGKLASTAKDWRAGQFRRSDLSDVANTIEACAPSWWSCGKGRFANDHPSDTTKPAVRRASR